MRKDFGPKNYLFPMPVLMIATYGDNDEVDVMNMAWGGICDSDKVALNGIDGKGQLSLFFFEADSVLALRRKCEVKVNSVFSGCYLNILKMSG